MADYSVLEEKDMKVLDDWVKYFTKRYNIVRRTRRCAHADLAQVGSSTRPRCSADRAGIVTPPAQLSKM